MDTDTLRAVTEAFNAHDVEAILRFFTDDASFDSPRGPDPWGRRFVGKEDIRRAITARFEDIPDVHYGHVRHVVAGDRGVSEWRLTGTTPEGKQIDVRGCDVWEFRGDAIARKDSYWKIVDPRKPARMPQSGGRSLHGRRLSDAERHHLLALPLPGVLSTLGQDGAIHSVPVHFLTRDEAILFVTERASVKSMNMLRTKRASICVSATLDGERWYATAHGTSQMDDGVSSQDLVDLERRYFGAADPDGPDMTLFVDSATVRLVPDRWIAWADGDPP